MWFHEFFNEEKKSHSVKFENEISKPCNLMCVYFLLNSKKRVKMNMYMIIIENVQNSLMNSRNMRLLWAIFKY